VTTLLVGDPQLDTSLSPLVSVWQNPPTPSAELRENMRELVSQSSVDFGRMLEQSWIQRNQFQGIISAASGCFETRIPFNAKIACDFIGAIGAQQAARFCFKLAVSVPASLCEALQVGVTFRVPQGRGYSLKRKFELPKQRHTRSFACSGDQQFSALHPQPL
jgi:hypothetical protein